MTVIECKILIWRFVITKVSLFLKVTFWKLYVLSKIVSFFVIIQNEYNCKLDLSHLNRLGLSHLREHKFDTLYPICNCGEDIETSCHYLFYCSLYTNKRLTLLNVFSGIDNNILEVDDSHIVEKLLLRIKVFKYFK